MARPVLTLLLRNDGPSVLRAQAANRVLLSDAKEVGVLMIILCLYCSIQAAGAAQAAVIFQALAGLVASLSVAVYGMAYFSPRARSLRAWNRRVRNQPEII